MAHKYKPRNFDYLLGIEGLSDQLLKNHFSLYNAYVENTNKIFQELDVFSKEDMEDTPEYAEMKRRLGWEWNGMRLHEYYFSNIIKGGKPLDTNTNLYKKIIDNFGSYQKWERDFKATGSIRGMGWVVMYYDPLVGELSNVWINEHNANHFCGGHPILVMDVFEHAYMTDYGIRKSDYILSFFKIINWKINSEMDTIFM